MLKDYQNQYQNDSDDDSFDLGLSITKQLPGHQDGQFNFSINIDLSQQVNQKELQAKYEFNMRGNSQQLKHYRRSFQSNQSQKSIFPKQEYRKKINGINDKLRLMTLTQVCLDQQIQYQHNNIEKNQQLYQFSQFYQYFIDDINVGFQINKLDISNNLPNAERQIKFKTLDHNHYYKRKYVNRMINERIIEYKERRNPFPKNQYAKRIYQLTQNLQEVVKQYNCQIQSEQHLHQMIQNKVLQQQYQTKKNIRSLALKPIKNAVSTILKDMDDKINLELQLRRKFNQLNIIAQTDQQNKALSQATSPLHMLSSRDLFSIFQKQGQTQQENPIHSVSRSKQIRGLTSYQRF